MSVQFRCPQCQRKLNAPRHKVGRRVRCPSCRQAIIVPDEQRAAVGESQAAAVGKVQHGGVPDGPAAFATVAAPPRSPEPPVLPEPPQPPELPASDSASGEPPGLPPAPPPAPPSDDLVVYDEPPLFVDDEGGYGGMGSLPTSELIGVPRRMLYAQAVLIVLVAVGGLVVGFVLGRYGAPLTATDAAPEPISIGGVVSYRNAAGQTVADSGAVVVVVPINQPPVPSQRPMMDGFGPLSAAPPPDHPVLRAIASQGGAYVRANQEGRFEATLPQRGQYGVLLISRHAQRSAEAAFEPNELAAMLEHLGRVPNLIGDQKHHWSTAPLRDGSQLAHDFGATAR
jgi:DNA-directed RNA polymerase subunit RPC12/RpoP